MTDPLLQRGSTPAPPEHPHVRPPGNPAVHEAHGGSPLALTILVVAAIAGELAAHTSLATMAGGVAVVACGTVILLAPSRRRPEVVVPMLLAILLATNLVLRSSPWVVAPSALAIAALLVVAAQDRLLSTSRSLSLLVAVVWIESLLRAPQWALGRIVPSGTWGHRQFLEIVRGTLAAVAIAGLLMALFASGDAVFSSFLEDALGGSLSSHAVVGVLCFLLFSTLGVSSSRDRPLPMVSPSRQEAKIEGFMGLGAMATVLSIWCATQVIVALGGAERLLATDGLTRAEYARTGFFQLVAVAAVVIAVLSALDRITPRITMRQKQLFAGLSTLVATQTVVLVYVTFTRLSLYIDAFGLTMLRLSVACFLGWLGVVLILVLLRLLGLGARRTWTPMASFCLAATATLAFGWANPEAVVATSNLSRSGAIELDTPYLARLSADAEPAIVRALPTLDPASAEDLRRRLCDKDPYAQRYGPLGWNRAQDLATVARGDLQCS